MAHKVHRLIAATLAAALAAQAAGAHDLRDHSPARQLLGQMLGQGGFVALGETAGRGGAHWHDDRPGLHGVIPALVGRWSLTAFRSEEHGMIRILPEPGHRFELAANGRLSVSVGCNQISGRVMTSRQGRFDVHGLVSTRMACPRDEARLEARLTELLHRVARHERRGDRLMLLDRRGILLLDLDAGPRLMLPCQDRR
ncbi:MAG: hypothetical protein Kow0013_18690 [Pararhodobacter sp.]